MKIIYKRVVDQVMSKYGQIDILVNSTVVQHYSTTLEKGLFEAHERRKLYYQNDHGVSAGLLDYSSTKSAIVSVTRALALKLINEGIGVNAEAPGPLWTPLQRASLPV
ncbi:NADPH-dependent aldehyde reductase 1, chloroplastic-like [Populus nigra]|uniref:NADPH-dependent aldehyde reductase 1, chloroplastic-like n=1 Tax=Populus nigra TaxID=3691 RepID=UPI002B277723|nr:NADPH-dependent aldehyde reductase 1, chloroplastic-like [Populus nigra]